MSEDNNSTNSQESSQNSTKSNLKNNLETHLNMKTFWMIFLPIFSGSVILVLLVVAIWFVVDFRKPISSITVTGTAKSAIIPDKAIVSMYSEILTSNQEEANTKLDVIEKDAKEYLAKEGISENKIVINRSFEKNFRYAFPLEDESAVSNEDFMARLTFDLTFDGIQNDTAKPRRIVDEMMKIGVTFSNQFMYQIDNEEELCKDLEIKATSNALERSQDQISALGGGRIIKKSVRESFGCGQNMLYPFFGGRAEPAMTSEMSSVSNPLTLNPGETELMATVILEVEYK